MSYWLPAFALPDLLISLVELAKNSVVLLVTMAIAFLAIAIQFLTVHGLFGNGETAPNEGWRNCGECGARISSDAEHCEYCGELVD